MFWKGKTWQYFITNVYKRPNQYFSHGSFPWQLAKSCQKMPKAKSFADQKPATSIYKLYQLSPTNDVIIWPLFIPIILSINTPCGPLKQSKKSVVQIGSKRGWQLMRQMTWQLIIDRHIQSSRAVRTENAWGDRGHPNILILMY